MLRSFDNAAAIPNSCCSQSRYATAHASGGLINPRIQHDGPKMNLAFDGELRDAFCPKAESIQRLNPSLPTVRLFSRIFDTESINSRNSETCGCMRTIS